MTDFEIEIWDGRLNGPIRESKHRRYRRNNSNYRSREKQRQQNRDYSELYKQRREDTQFRPFIGWDTEGDNRTATPFLFGSSAGDYLASPNIQSRDIFELILQRKEVTPKAIHVIYGGEYDFNMFLKDVTQECLIRLRETTVCRWAGYRISHIPRKWFQISNGITSARIYDVVSFFGCPYLQALENFGIGTPEQRALIKEGKSQRSFFGFDNLEYIERYWRAELELLPKLMNVLRDAFIRGGMRISSWHGPGALAKYMLQKHNVKEALSETPQPVHVAARYAFCGGRFESFYAGLYDGPVYNADINSAYPYAIQFLPNLAVGGWAYLPAVDRDKISPDDFAVYHIKYKRNYNTQTSAFGIPPAPLFRRYPDDSVHWRQVVEGWYWAPEAATVAQDEYAEFYDAWIYREKAPRPFEWIAEYYDHRAYLKRMGDAAELGFKLGCNSVYGQLAQRAGWQKGIPKYHQIEWAGYVTSRCRAMVYEAARKAFNRDELISIDTDGIYTTGPIPETDLQNGYGNGLGQWKPSNLSGILYWQSGIYWTRSKDTGKWEFTKFRGIPAGKIEFGTALAALENIANERPIIGYDRDDFIGYRRALRQDETQWRYFVPKTISLVFGGAPGSKRAHNKRSCRLCRELDKTGPMHDLTPSPKPEENFPYHSYWSRMHVLPWEENDHVRTIEHDILELQTEEVVWEL